MKMVMKSCINMHKQCFFLWPTGSFLPNVELARDMQDMRIRKKKRQTIRILPGKLFETKTSAASRIPLKAAGAGKTPARYTRQQVRAGLLLFVFLKPAKSCLKSLGRCRSSSALQPRGPSARA